MDSSDDMIDEYERQSWLLMQALVERLNEEGARPMAVNIRALTLALAWCVAQSHVQQELTDVDRSVELIAAELRRRIREMAPYI